MHTLKVLIPFISKMRASHWERSVALLNRTVESVLYQDHAGGYVVLIGHDLPQLQQDILRHERFQFVKVDYDPADIHPSADKSHKLAFGLMASEHVKTAWQMALDADDVPHRELVSWLASRKADGGGFQIDLGYQLDYRRRRGFPCNHLQKICGSTIVLRSDLVTVPLDDNESELKRCIWFRNGHLGIPIEMADNGFALEPVPFRSLLYTVNHAGDWQRIYKKNALVELAKRQVKFAPLISVNRESLNVHFRIDK